MARSYQHIPVEFAGERFPSVSAWCRRYGVDRTTAYHGQCARKSWAQILSEYCRGLKRRLYELAPPKKKGPQPRRRRTS